MFKKLHRQLTFFCALVTGLILMGMTMFSLYINETRMWERDYAAFENNFNNLVLNMSSQSSFDDRWITQSSNDYQMHLYIRNNGTPLYMYQINPHPEELQDALTEVETIAANRERVDVTTLTSSSTRAVFQMSDGIHYGACAVLPRYDGFVSVTAYSDPSKLQGQIQEQRLTFLAIDLVGLILLAVFSWLFTAHTIRPIEESRRRQTQFVAAASHELRTPLAVMLSSLSAMEKAAPHEQPRFSSYIRDEGERMSSLIDDLLTLSSADNEQWKTNFSPVELDTLLLDTYEKYQPVMAATQLELQILLPDQVIPTVSCDRQRIGQVLSILLRNACSYVPAKGHVKLSASLSKKQVLLQVIDDGPGISDAEKEKVFERFYRSDSSRKDREHFGLGLCIAREIMELHSGSIAVSDTPGGGCTFTVSLPVASRQS